MEQVLTSTILWQNFDPAAEPLDTNVFKIAEADGLEKKSVYFTGRTVADGASRVLGKVCKKGKTCKHAVLLIDNYKNPIDERELEYWAQNGFVAMAIDFAGRCSKGLCTLYPPSLDKCNSDVAESYFFVGEDIRENKIYEYALNCMRAVTYLLQEEKVQKVSVITVKKGSAVGIVVLSVDRRLANGTVVFGSLHRDYPAAEEEHDLDELNRKELEQHLADEEKRHAWMSCIAPQSYAMQTKIPVYVIVSANSPHVSSVNSNKMYNRLNDDSRMLLLPTTMDYLPDMYVQGIVKWCKGTSVKEEIELSQVKEEDAPDNAVMVTTSLPQSKVSLWYSRNPDSPAQNWVKAALKKTEGGYIAELDVYAEKCNIIAFAVQKGTVNIATALEEIKVTRPSKVKTPMRSLFSGGSDDTLVPVAFSANWHGEKNQVEYCKGYLNIEGAKGKALATFAVNDPCVRRKEIFTVSFDVCCNVAQTLRVYAMSHFGFSNNVYSQTVQLLGDGKWQRITVEGADFHGEDGRQMPEDEHVEMFTVEADEEFIVNNMFLV